MILFLKKGNVNEDPVKPKEEPLLKEDVVELLLLVLEIMVCFSITNQLRLSKKFTFKIFHLLQVLIVKKIQICQHHNSDHNYLPSPLQQRLRQFLQVSYDRQRLLNTISWCNLVFKTKFLWQNKCSLIFIPNSFSDPALNNSQRISILRKKIQELQKTYNNIKQELSSIERRRKKLRRREREKKAMSSKGSS